VFGLILEAPKVVAIRRAEMASVLTRLKQLVESGDSN
jgi:hypothetical protein